MIVDTSVASLTPVSEEERQAMRDSERSCERHQQWMRETACIGQLERHDLGSDTPLAHEFRVGAWNLERCLDPEGTARVIDREQLDVVLLTELDCGMARSFQRHTTLALAELLGMHALYGVEFIELDLGCDTEVAIAEDDYNRQGWHGNALLSKAPITRAQMLRLDDHGHWFAGQKVGDYFGQPRVGGRMAILAEIATEQGPVVMVSSHLESTAGEQTIAYRDAQMVQIIEAAERFANGAPIVIGGDLNTGNNLSPKPDWQLETLFASAEQRGYHWRANAPGITTRPSRITLENAEPKKLDWFCAKGLEGRDAAIVAALDEQGIALSDHELITALFRFS